jgi:hypothetical protein
VANYHAVAAVSQAVLGLLENARASSEFESADFKLYRVDDFGSGMNGVSLYLYRTEITEMRTAIRRPSAEHEGTPLPLTLSYLLTPWAPDAASEHRLLSWTMRVLADTPILSSTDLNRARADVFQQEDTVQLSFYDLSLEEMASLWSAMKQPYRLSIPCQARIVNINQRIQVIQ